MPLINTVTAAGQGSAMARTDGATVAGALQDSAMARSDSAAAGSTALAQPEMRTPQNVGYLQAAYVAAGVVYITYLIVLRRRWVALQARRRKGAAMAPGR